MDLGFCPASTEKRLRTYSCVCVDRNAGRLKKFFKEGQQGTNSTNTVGYRNEQIIINDFKGWLLSVLDDLDKFPLNRTFLSQQAGPDGDEKLHPMYHLTCFWRMLANLSWMCYEMANDRGKGKM